MKPSVHFYASAALGGAVYAATGSAACGGACLLAGVLLDLDHLPDYLLDSREGYSVKGFLDWCYALKWRKVYLVLHSYELLALLALAAWLFPRPALSGALLGMALHLALDQAGNTGLNRWFYFLAFRWRAGFARGPLGRAGRGG